MNDQKVFVDGLLVKLPDDNAPDFVKLKLSIKLDEFGPWVAARKKADPDSEWMNIEIKEGRSGKWYAELNTWKPSADQPARQPARQPAPAPTEDIPW
ncbi:MAG: hypothetical protein VW715_08265 [Rhodospirillales bacterium]|jgi:hypothetical protein